MPILPKSTNPHLSASTRRRPLAPPALDQAVQHLRAAAPDATIVLFGSRARGDAHAESDVDLLVVEPHVLDKLLADPDAPLEIFGFHAQQTAEKLLKAVLSHAGIGRSAHSPTRRVAGPGYRPWPRTTGGGAARSGLLTNLG